MTINKNIYYKNISPNFHKSSVQHLLTDACYTLETPSTKGAHKEPLEKKKMQ